jgi:hypothetical protein
MNDNLHRCSNLLCDRMTTAEYCCAPCRTAAEDSYEIHDDGPLGHSDGCNKRNKKRSSSSGHGHKKWREQENGKYVSSVVTSMSV